MSERSSEWKPLWTAVPLPAVPLLAELRERVLRHNGKRAPKWGFRHDGELVFQLQPCILQPSITLPRLFDLEALSVPAGAPSNAFRVPMREMPSPCLHLKGKIIMASPGGWSLRIVGGGGAYGLPLMLSDCLALRVRLVEALDPTRWQHLAVDRLLSPRCLMCGKALTDPVSMARLIGPECAGTSAVTTRMYRLADPK